MPDLIVSVVTGTYNRLYYLMRMVASIRRSIGVGIPYEIVIVDGGSSDGSIKWCKEQKDIKLIEHGKLLGAVKAFNDGAYAARGIYVILANDDVEFVDESILSSVSFMQDNKNVGIGCFYQDRNGLQWHVDSMMAISPDGRQVSSYYGQVCIVPRWIGDRVGWWGDYLKTYGGDNEISCNVLEFGYKIMPIPCACIHDPTPNDELRTINRIDGEVNAVNGTHPDTYKWVQKWKKPGNKLGPIISNVPKEDNTLLRSYRILYAPIYEKGFPFQKQTKHGLRDALSEYMLVSECDYVNSEPGYIFDIAAHFRPDMFFLQIQSIGNEFSYNMVRELKSLYKNSLFVNWNGDYHPEHLYNPNYIAMLKLFDLVGLVTTEVKNNLDYKNVNWMYWQIGYEDSIAMPVSSTPRHDILFLANAYSDDRLALGNKLRERYGDRIGIYGSWPKSVHPNGYNLYDFDSGAKLYRACKVAISDSQWPHATGFVSNRLFQSMSVGACLLQQRFDGMKELLGLEDEKHLVTWNTYDELCHLIDYYSSHENERKRIAKEGCEFIRTNHSFDVRVKELFGKLQSIGKLQSKR